MKLLIDVKPLTVNKAWKGRRYKTADYEKYETDIALLLPYCETPFEGPIEVTYYFHMKNHKLSDWDNPIKPIQDILVKRGYIIDDRYIYAGHGYKIPDDEEYIEVHIKPFKQKKR